MAKTKKVSPFRRGSEVLSSASGSGGMGFVSLKDGDSVVLSPLHGLDQMISADMHEYWDIRPAIFHPCISPDNCPGEEAGNEPRFKAYLPVVTKSGDVLIWGMTIKVARQVQELEEELGGNIGGHVLKVKRNGSGLATNYVVIGTGKTVKVDKIEVPDFIEALGPSNREDILALLEGRGISVGSSSTDTPFEVDEDEDDDDGDDLSDWEEIG